MKETILSQSIGAMLSKQGKDFARQSQAAKDAQPIRWECSDADKALSWQLAERAVSDAKLGGVELDHMTVQMDIMTVHCNGSSLKLLQLLMCDLTDFARELRIIGLGIDRKTGKLHEDAKRQLRFLENVQ